jgi:hypothetical protein
VHFISGVTKSKELAEQEAEEKANDPLSRRTSSLRAAIEQQSVLSPTTSHLYRHGGHHQGQETAEQERRSEEVVVDRNERAAERTIARHGGSPEPSVPERSLGTVRSPNEDPADPSSNYTLPVVEEAASESGSTQDGSIDARLERASRKLETYVPTGSTQPAPGNVLARQVTASPQPMEPQVPTRSPPPTPPEEPKAPTRAAPPTPPEMEKSEFEKRMNPPNPPSKSAIDAQARQVKA